MKEVWATYSVRDHLAPKAFMADVMLYDRLVIPIPAPGDEVHWNDWNPRRQEELLKILDKRAVTIVWDRDWQEKWKSQWEAANALGQRTSAEAFRATPDTLLEAVPKTVTGVAAVATFASAEEMQAALGMRPVQAAQNVNLGAGSIPAIIGREFMVPDDPNTKDDDLLRAALEISSDTRFKQKRAAYWRWQREFLSEVTVLDQSALDAAAEEMSTLIDEEKTEARKTKVRMGLSFAFAAGAAAIGIFTPPLAPIAFAGGFLSIGGWAIDHVPEYLDGQRRDPRPSAMCVSAQREFGWRP